MERAAWNALANGQNKTAADIFRQALASDPNNAQLHVGAATAAYADQPRRRREERTRSRARARSRSWRPRRQLWDSVLHRKGDLLGAIRVYESLAVIQPPTPRPRRRSIAGGASSICSCECSRCSAITSRSRSKVPAEEAIAAKAVASLNRALDRVCCDAQHLSDAHDSRRPLHDGAVHRHHARAVVGGGGVRRDHPRADAWRARRRSTSSTACSPTSSRTRSSTRSRRRRFPHGSTRASPRRSNRHDLDWARQTVHQAKPVPLIGAAAGRSAALPAGRRGSRTPRARSPSSACSTRRAGSPSRT